MSQRENVKGKWREYVFHHPPFFFSSARSERSVQPKANRKVVKREKTREWSWQHSVICIMHFNLPFVTTQEDLNLPSYDYFVCSILLKKNQTFVIEIWGV